MNNEQSTDAVVSLAPVNSTAAALMMYVRANQTATVDGIHDGSYKLFVTSGSDWDTGTKSFTRSCAYQQLSQVIDLTSSGHLSTVETLNLAAGAGTDANGLIIPSDARSFPT